MKNIISVLLIIVLIAACKKSNTPESSPLKPLIDIDGNRYDTIKIFSQFLMKQNLKTSYYRNGDPIPEITSDAIWSTLTTGAWCWYNNDSATFAATYGKLYNWYAVNDPRGLAPTGWHIPSYLEWTSLSSDLGGNSVAGGKMKEMGTAHWTTPNIDASNSSGFTGLPGGFRNYNGTFFNIGTNGYWWSSTEHIISNAWIRNLFFNTGNLTSFSNNKRNGHSVRCLRD